MKNIKLILVFIILYFIFNVVSYFVYRPFRIYSNTFINNNVYHYTKIAPYFPLPPKTTQMFRYSYYGAKYFSRSKINTIKQFYVDYCKKYKLKYYKKENGIIITFSDNDKITIHNIETTYITAKGTSFNVDYETK